MPRRLSASREGLWWDGAGEALRVGERGSGGGTIGEPVRVHIDQTSLGPSEESRGIRAGRRPSTGLVMVNAWVEIGGSIAEMYVDVDVD